MKPIKSLNIIDITGEWLDKQAICSENARPFQE
jgi:hypothetical protein